MEQLSEFIANHPVLVCAFVVLLVMLIATEMKRGGQNLSPALVGGVINRQDGVVLDVRADSEFRAGHIAGSVGIPHSQLASRLEEMKKYLGKPVVVVCTHGTHSGEVARTLLKAGHAPVYCLAGGITAWRGDNLPVVRG